MTTTPPPTTSLPLPYGAPLTLDVAKRIMAAAEQEAAAHHWPMAIAIVDSTAHLVMFQRADNTQLGSMDVSIAKAMTAVKFRRATKIFEDAMAAGGADRRGRPGGRRHRRVGHAVDPGRAGGGGRTRRAERLIRKDRCP